MIGSILHQSGISIWDNSNTWGIQNGINIDYTSGDAIVGSGADFTLVAGSNYNVDSTIQIKASGISTPIILGHGLSNDLANNFAPKTAGLIYIKEDGIYEIKYSGKLTGNVANLYNVFILNTEEVPNILDVEKLSLVFRQI